MSLGVILSTFQADAFQCSSLLANIHHAKPSGEFFFAIVDRKQVVIAAFLNLYIAWESFLESALAEFMVGGLTTTGGKPIKYVFPRNISDAHALVVGVQKYFDYSNPDNVKKIARLYFENGYPFEPHLSSITTDLFDMKILRNSSAHISSTTTAAFNSLAQRILRNPSKGIDLYTLLLSKDPRSTTHGTVFSYYQELLLAAAELIARG